MSDEPIVSPDTRRDNRVPPRQVITHKWPVLHVGEVPPFDPARWSFTLFPIPLVDKVKQFTWDQFCALPRVKVFADMHCVTRWSLLDNMWEGVSTRELLNHVTIAPAAKFVMVHCGYGFSTNMTLDEFFGVDSVFAMMNIGEVMSPDQRYHL